MFEDDSAIKFWIRKDGNGMWECNDQSVIKGALAFIFLIKRRPHCFMP